MTEYLHDAWSGWTGYTTNGKLPALLLAVLLCLWFGKGHKEQRALLCYTSVTAVCCILPVTAAVLMLYQTRFYHYEWIWSLVPMTAVTAYGITLLWTKFISGRAGQWKMTVPVTLLLLTALCLCGSMGRQVWGARRGKEERACAYAVLDQIADRYPGAALCLWAPREIMEYAREKDASIRLPYGRNIWDGALDAYSYDVYTEDIALLEQWMENVGRTGQADMETISREGGLPAVGTWEGGPEAGTAEEGTPEAWQTAAETEEPGRPAADESDGRMRKTVSLEQCVERAREQGVNCVLLPYEAKEETILRMEKSFGVKGEELGSYYLFYADEEDTYGRAD